MTLENATQSHTRCYLLKCNFGDAVMMQTLGPWQLNEHFQSQGSRTARRGSIAIVIGSHWEIRSDAIHKLEVNARRIYLLGFKSFHTGSESEHCAHMNCV